MTIEYAGGFSEPLKDTTSKSKILRLLKRQCVHSGKLFADKMESINDKFCMSFLEKTDWQDQPWFVARIYGTMQDLNEIAENLPRWKG